MFQQRRLLQNVIRLTPSGRTTTSNTERSAPSIIPASELPNRKSHLHVQMSYRRNALTGASIVALGTGAFLCARAYSKSCSRNTSGTSTSGRGTASFASPKALSAARSNTETPAAAAAAATAATAASEKNNGVGPDRAAETSPPAQKQPCGGCDCGLMEPGPLEGTMHAYERHIIICSGHEDWPKVVEAEESSLAESLFNLCLGAGLILTKKVALAAKQAGAPNNKQVKISACSEPSRGREGTTDVIVYPEGLIYSLSRDDASSLEQFVNVQLIEGRVASQLEPISVSYKKMVLVCTHMSRDKRCGRAGPQVVGEMTKALEAKGVGPDEIAVRGSSHFGGHKYAGVLIIYPQGDWFGLVSKKNASAIVDKCVLGTEGMKANWRGNMASPGTKAQPAKKPKPTAAETTADASPSPVPTTTLKHEPEEQSGSAPVNGRRPRRESIDGA